MAKAKPRRQPVNHYPTKTSEEYNRMLFAMYDVEKANRDNCAEMDSLEEKMTDLESQVEGLTTICEELNESIRELTKVMKQRLDTFVP